MPRYSIVDWASWVLTTVGSINWGLVGTTGFDLVRGLFGRDTFVTRLVYTLVGAAGVWSLFQLVSMIARPTVRREVARRWEEAA
ncbi:MAG TPA: DUF378 domain-containing protein [Chloroflexota bacterium]|jgi:uncharacterized membrane protein YuzA (DUF378 family)